MPPSSCDVHPTRASYNHSIQKKKIERDESLRKSNRERKRFNSRNCTLNLRYTPNRVTPANRRADLGSRSTSSPKNRAGSFQPSEIILGLFSDSFYPQLRLSLATAIYAIAVIAFHLSFALSLAGTQAFVNQYYSRQRPSRADSDDVLEHSR